MSTFNKTNPIAKAVRTALFATAAASFVVAPNAFADEESADDEGQKVTITGSRISRSDLEGASPVETISSLDMTIEGSFTVADALRGTSFNSFGSFSERSGSSAQSQATISLRGMGANRTLILMDGRRLAPSPTLGGQSVNLNSIPFAAVERVEILTDGASSVYGSDAIAGVVNIIMKKDYEGLEFNYAVGQRDRDSGTTSKEFSVVGGLSSDKGNVTLAVDMQQRLGISDGARDFTKAKFTDLNGDGEIQAYTETDGWSIYGATVAAPDFSSAQASPLCNDLIAQYGSDTFALVKADDDWSAGSTYCMYAYANVSYNKASIDRTTVYVDADYQISDNIEFFVRAMTVNNKSFGRYAPPAAPWNNLPATSPHNPYGAATRGYFRWVGIGTRDGLVDDNTMDFTFGFKGDLDSGATWETYYHTSDVDNKSVGRSYLSYGGLAYNVANNIDLGSPEGVANMKITTLTQSTLKFDQWFAGIGFDAGELSGGDIAHYAGIEYIEQDYKDIYDAQSEAGRVGGSAGNSAQGARDLTAVFYEAVLPVIDDLELNLAVRYDDYSDFGDNFAPKISARWEPAEGLVLRASYTEAFRAPGLDELYAATSFSAESAIDYRTGATNARQYDTYIKSNSNLGPETSEYINLGVAYDFTEDFSVKLDYFQIEIEDVIQQKSVQGLLSDEAAGRITAVAPGTDVSNETFYLIRAASGTLLQAGTGNYNGVGFDLQGVDLTFSGSFDTGAGKFGINWVNSFVLEYNTEVGGVMTDVIGWSGRPDFKSTATFTWTMDEHNLAWNMNYIADTLERQPGTPVATRLGTGKMDAWLIHNLNYSFDAGDYGIFRFGINNVTDEDPPLTSSGQYNNASLYNNYGREYRLGYSIKF